MPAIRENQIVGGRAKTAKRTRASNRPLTRLICNQLPNDRHERQELSEQQKSLIEGKDELRNATRHDRGGKFIEADFVLLLDRHFHATFGSTGWAKHDVWRCRGRDDFARRYWGNFNPVGTLKRRFGIHFSGTLFRRLRPLASARSEERRV